jgi:hypothetical protein
MTIVFPVALALLSVPLKQSLRAMLITRSTPMFASIAVAALVYVPLMLLSPNNSD